ncbi:diaminopimelate epimerase [Desulfoluna sp.]|uniref:diaminopimelate epimerase n=1 Tax=Desulfoluna sp. TaxID=2045199 RepID=UPI0026386FB5|nr:diaminopimelate epimerase [Desulfoluna sp.]
MVIDFAKMEGLGNDFILLDDMDGALGTLGYAALAKKLCDRRFGVGADGMILALPSDSCDIGFRIFNSDGSEAEMCGNGMRCFAAFVTARGLLSGTRFRVETKAGVIVPEIIEETRNGVTQVCVDMGEPVLKPRDIPFDVEGDRALSVPLIADEREFAITAVSMGNPHAVIVVDHLTGEEPTIFGSAIETHPLFPVKTNVEFVEVVSPSEVKMRVWERGAGETLACGTGACATAVATHLLGLTGRQVTVGLKGGDLAIAWNEGDNHILKTGPATLAFEGRVRV